MTFTKRFFLAGAVVLALAPTTFSGGFYLQLGNPKSSAEARAKNAVLTVLATGCHEPEKAALSGKAIGLEGGTRRTIPLKLDRLKAPGMFALTQQWPAKGRWVLEIIGENKGMTTSAVLVAGPDGVDRTSAKFYSRRPEASEIDAALNLSQAVAKR